MEEYRQPWLLILFSTDRIIKRNRMWIIRIIGLILFIVNLSENPPEYVAAFVGSLIAYGIIIGAAYWIASDPIQTVDGYEKNDKGDAVAKS